MEDLRRDDPGGPGRPALARVRPRALAPTRCKVLLAGDGREHRARLATILRGQGFEVTEFGEWMQLVQHVREAPLFEIAGDPGDVIVLDLRASGAGALERVSAAAPPGAPMVVITVPGGLPTDPAMQDNWVTFEDPLDVELLRKAVIGVSQLRA
jgi:CheY-like chemotaxis protein